MTPPAPKSPATPTLTTTATAASPAGVYPITVVDSGTLSAPNYDFPAAGFVNGTLTVTPATSASVVAGSTLPNSTYGQSIRFTATVSGGGPVPTGTVQFIVDGTNFGNPVALVNGSATSTATTTLGASCTLRRGPLLGRCELRWQHRHYSHSRSPRRA